MGGLTFFIKMGCALFAASILGNWFLIELKKARSFGKPWFAVYLTAPGIIIILIVLVLPFIVHMKSG